MTGLEIVGVIASLANLAQKMAVENREATAEEVAASFKSRDGAMTEAEKAVARLLAREAGE